MKNLLLLTALLFTYTIDSPNPLPNWDFDAQYRKYLAAKTEQIYITTKNELANIKDWSTYKKQAREELKDMLGLLPFPQKTDLKATITGTVETEEFTVEKVHFQSMPGLYVTGNLYIPKNVQQPMPAILYVCGHATMKKDGYNYGSKTHYQHHPSWFARHGFVCLILDTLQLGEIEGIHHGLYRFDHWWWISRGYTPAGVEAWNGIRAIDYLTSRPEVAADKIGVTGRSGGGASSWWIAALDERVKVAVPVAGITDMQDHIVDGCGNGCVKGHCDCMYMHNIYKWDFAKLAALIAPRPLLLSNTDKDPIFPIEGVFRIYQQVKGLYKQLEATDNFALHITAGPHQDVQELRIHAFRWMNHFLYNRDDLIEKPATKLFQPEQLRVYKELPVDAINTKIDELFTPVAPSALEQLKKSSLHQLQNQWQQQLEQKVFKNWTKQPKSTELEKLDVQKQAFASLTTYSLQTDTHTTLPVFHIRPARKSDSKKSLIIVLDDTNWSLWAERLAAFFPKEHFWKDLPKNPRRAEEVEALLTKYSDLFFISSRGSGLAKFKGDKKQQIQIRRRYYLLGESLQLMQTWDILKALRAITKNQLEDPVAATANGVSAGMLLYASLFSDKPLSLELNNLPESHVKGPYYPRIMRYMDTPAAVLMAGGKHEVVLKMADNVPQYTFWQKLIKVKKRNLALDIQVRHEE